MLDSVQLHRRGGWGSWGWALGSEGAISLWRGRTSPTDRTAKPW